MVFLVSWSRNHVDGDFGLAIRYKILELLGWGSGSRVIHGGRFYVGRTLVGSLCPGATPVVKE